ncbi:uncharacterized protein P884DRAFT_255487, partial [Thermothelomyces heterothallicus CBS 202.75]|uniref:uncharacterized protein n=1 Tax=Thermothelomyces heterothallicus CBS 202.75 TaxID=1149848 RepID=UPI003743ACA9
MVSSLSSSCRFGCSTSAPRPRSTHAHRARTSGATPALSGLILAFTFRNCRCIMIPTLLVRNFFQVVSLRAPPFFFPPVSRLDVGSCAEVCCCFLVLGFVTSFHPSFYCPVFA